MGLGSTVLFSRIALPQPKGSSDLTRILEIAINTDDKSVMWAIYSKAKSGDSDFEKAMRTANPERFVSLAEMGRIGAEELQFLMFMAEFGNKYAREAIKSMKR